MKAIKTILPLLVVIVIGFFVWKSCVKYSSPGVIPPPRNQFVERIEHEIDSLTKLPANNFCKNFHDEIQYHISDYFKQKFLGSNDKDNNQWENILSKNLYSAYAPKFVQQSLYVFKNSQWEIIDLNFIRNEIKTLQFSNYLEQSSSIDKSFKEILTILSKYDEITNFIYNCSNFPYPSFELNAKFPLNEVANKIQVAKKYLNNEHGIPFINNCARLRIGLIEVPRFLFLRHVNYLRLKILKLSGNFSDYSSQKNYSDIFYTPLKSEIKLLDNHLYNVNSSEFDNGYQDLKNRLDSDNNEAYKYFSKLKSN